MKLDHCGEPPPVPAKPARAGSAPPRRRLSAVSDWERSNAFYRDVLGAEVVQRDEWFGFYVFDDWQFNVHGPGFEGLNAQLPVQPGGSDLCFRWDGPIEEGPRSAEFPRGRITSVYFRDPDGSLLEFLSYD